MGQVIVLKGIGLKTALVGKLEEELIKQFPAPASVKLEDHEGTIGVITSAPFPGMESIDCQSLIGSIVETHVAPQVRHQVLVIVGVNPDEGSGYLAGDE